VHGDYDDIWSLCCAKARNVPYEHEGQFGYGDLGTWTAICVDTKIAPSWLIGERGGTEAEVQIRELASRLANPRVQLTMDGQRAYLNVEAALGADIDYAVLHTTYSDANGKSDERCYSHREHRHQHQAVTDKADLAKASTSYVERQNLTMRLGMRRFTRLTNGFSDKAAHHVVTGTGCDNAGATSGAKRPGGPKHRLRSHGDTRPRRGGPLGRLPPSSWTCYEPNCSGESSDSAGHSPRITRRPAAGNLSGHGLVVCPSDINNRWQAGAQR